jgi:hypothetical protein
MAWVSEVALFPAAIAGMLTKAGRILELITISTIKIQPSSLAAEAMEYSSHLIIWWGALKSQTEMISL